MTTLVHHSPAPPHVETEGPRREFAWARPALLVLLVATGVLYLWNLSINGYANSFYAAAAQAGSHSWKAWFFGSLDAGNSITVDKPPASLWVSGLSARIFGFNSWSVLAPQALEGVAAVGLLYAAVRRVSGTIAGLVAGALLALTPAATLMFRFDNPDALLTLLLVAAGYFVVRALESAGARWLVLAGTALGFAFLTKMLQGFLVLPALALVYLVAAPTGLGRRVRQLLLAGVALVVSAGWWVAIVTLWPAASRPYIGGSTNNSVLQLVFGYNGFSRIFGQDGGSGGSGGMNGGAAGSSFGGATGLTRLLGSEMGNEISWLLPAAIVALVAGLIVTRRSARTDKTRAALLLWGGWLIVTAAVFSYMQGIVHPYYTVALAPAIAAVVATGGHALWIRRDSLVARIGLAATIVAGSVWTFVLLNRVASWHPELRYIVAVLAAVAVVGVLVAPRVLGRLAVVVLAAAVLSGSIGSAAFAIATTTSSRTGSIPSVGPSAAGSVAAGMGGPGAGGGNRLAGGGNAPSGDGNTPSGTGGMAPGDANGTSPMNGSPGGSAGGSTSSDLVAALEKTMSTWSAATAGDMSAAQLEIDSGTSVMAIGGWSGSDPSPTLAQFEKYVAEGKIHYFIAGGQSGQGGAGGPQGGGDVASQITSWVESHFTATTIGGQTVYDLTSSASG